jgi:hypothetical protein
MRFPTCTLATVALAAFASAQTTISPACESGLVSAFSSPDAACLNPTGLAAIVTTAANTSIVPAVDSWLTGLCALKPCTNQSLTNVVNTIATGCSAELASANVTASQVTDIVLAAYPSVRQIVCLKDNTNKVLCLTETLQAVEKIVGPLSPSNIGPAIEGVVSGQTTIPSSVICTDCNKAAYNIAQQNPVLAFPPSATTALSTTCGASFVDGMTPTTVSQTAQNAMSAKFKFLRGMTFGA